MPLVVEDGTGLPNADALVSVAEADAYHSAMGNAAWAGGADAKEAAIRRATQYLDTRYTYRGVPLTADQALAWPRDFPAWPVRRVQDACCELALRALAGSLYADQDPGIVTGETVGPVSVSYAEGQRNGGQVRFTLVDDMLSPYLSGGGRGSVRIERA